MTSKLLPILFMVFVVGLMAVPANAVGPDEFDSLITVDGSIVDTVEFQHIQSDDSFKIIVALQENVWDESVADNNIGVGIEYKIFNGTTPDIYYSGSVLSTTTPPTIIDGKLVMVDTINSYGLGISFSTTPGDVFTVSFREVSGQFLDGDGAITGNILVGTLVDTREVGITIPPPPVPAVCGYETTPSLDYGSMKSGQTQLESFIPTITDVEAFLQPSAMNFKVGSFSTSDGLNVVDATNTSINEIVGGNPGGIDITGIDTDTTFVFKTTLNFVDTTAYLNSIGQTITQTTTFTPTC